MKGKSGRPGPDLSGMTFGMLSVIGRTYCEKRNRTLWECRCECGKAVFLAGHLLTSGNNVSCGCKKKRFPAARKHGWSGRKLHNTWMAMRRRCSPSCPERAIAFYYEKGIRVCEEWSDFIAFKDWALANGYEDGLTIDRIDGNGNYEPGNCRWATMTQQNNNSARNRILELNGESKTLEKWAESLGVTPSAILGRIGRGWTVDRALTVKGGNRNAQP